MPESTRELSTHPKIVFKPISELKRYENNPRKNEHAVRAIANSIKEFGFKVPIVIDCNDVIVCGDTRYQACFELGITEVPCIIADDLTEEQIRAFRLADNKTAEIAEWDFEKLAEELDDILDIDMSEFGFDDGLMDTMGDDVTSDDIEDIGDSVKQSYDIIVKCDSESEQEETYEALTGMGYRCQTST